MMRFVKQRVAGSSWPEPARNEGLRTYRMVVFALSAVILCLVLTAATAPSGSNRILEAEQIILRGSDGKVRGVWGENPAKNGDGLLLYDDRGINRIGLHVFRNGESVLELRDDKGNGKLRIGVLQSGVPVVNLLADAQKESALVLQVGNNGSSLVVVGSRDQGNHVEISSAPDRGNSVVLHDSSGKPGIGVGISPTGDKRVSILSNGGKPRVGMALTRDQASSLLLDGAVVRDLKAR